jgi:hypothetical protein
MTDYSIWLEENYEELSIACSENGCDYEPDFDFEQFCEDSYNKEMENK